MEDKLIEVCRSFSYKLNAGNFESRDFFCSRKAECLESEASEKSKELHGFCEQNVMDSVQEYLERQLKIQEEKNDIKRTQIQIPE